MKRLRVAFGAALFATASLAQAFDLSELSVQLREPAVVRGTFAQEKHLRSLPKPLVSRGHYVLARDQGLLWLLDTPIEQDYRITASGIERRAGNAWQAAQPQGASGRQNQLSLALLSGDQERLSRDFELTLTGTNTQWTLSLTPKSALLKQIFSQIRLGGGHLVERVELDESQGDRTVLRLIDGVPGDELNDQERHDFLR
jgi:hypothetical protein